MKITYRIIAASTLLLPVLAFAHPGHEGTATFMTGFLHPMLGVDHILAALAVGLLAAHFSPSRRVVLPVLFVVSMLAALVAAQGLPAGPAIEMLVAFSLLVLGAVYFLGGRLPAISASAVVLFGAIHGYVHGTELPASGNSISYVLGLVIATAVAHGLGVLIGTRADPRVRFAAKIGAAMIASVGAALVGILLTG